MTIRRDGRTTQRGRRVEASMTVADGLWRSDSALLLAPLPCAGPPLYSGDGFRAFGRAAGVRGNGAGVCPRGVAAEGGGLGRARRVPGRSAAPGGGARLC